VTQGQSITLDPAENIYTMGIFFGTGDFDPGDDVFNLTSAGGSDVFISKLEVPVNAAGLSRIEPPLSRWLEVYPNPSNGTLIVRSEKIATLALTNALG
jgi:hypothetical protein